ncbi:hypothetical protein LINGRAHAP2_LOCUS26260 [Linum grandiflorum]
MSAIPTAATVAMQCQLDALRLAEAEKELVPSDPPSESICTAYPIPTEAAQGFQGEPKKPGAGRPTRQT